MEAYKIRKILVPVDFSPIAHNALETAIAMCKRHLSTLTLIYVIENSYLLFPPEAGGASADVFPQLQKDANDNLAKLSKDLRVKHDIVINHIVQAGNPADEICRLVLHKKYDLVVMGTHGTSGLREFFMGSNAYRVVKNASCPVMTIPGTQQWLDFKKILFPIRMVPHALDKYEYVRPIIRKNKANLLVAGIVKKTDSGDFIEMQKLVDTVRKRIIEDDVECNSEVHNCENVAREVLDIADTGKMDLIVITATLDNSLKDFFLGPYTQDIVNHAKVPVLSIRPQQSLMQANEVKEVTNESLQQPWALS